MTTQSLFFASSLGGALALVPSLAAAEAAEPGLLNPDGFVMIQGVPRLMLGMYELPSEDSTLAELAGLLNDVLAKQTLSISVTIRRMLNTQKKLSESLSTKSS